MRCLLGTAFLLISTPCFAADIAPTVDPSTGGPCIVHPYIMDPLMVDPCMVDPCMADPSMVGLCMVECRQISIRLDVRELVTSGGQGRYRPTSGLS
jgi:hypothetical protein